MCERENIPSGRQTRKVKKGGEKVLFSVLALTHGIATLSGRHQLILSIQMQMDDDDLSRTMNVLLFLPRWQAGWLAASNPLDHCSIDSMAI